MELDFELSAEGFRDIEIKSALPEELRHFKKLKPKCTIVRGAFGEVIFYEIITEGVMIRYSMYEILHPVILKVRADVPVLELRIALQNQIAGLWESIVSPSLEENYFSISYTSFVKTRAEFNRTALYATCDFHYNQPFLERLAKDFPIIDEFLETVAKKESMHIASKKYFCSPVMKETIEYIGKNPFGMQSQLHIAEDCAKEVLLAALEIMLEPEELNKKFILTDTHIDKLKKAKFIIEENIREERFDERITLSFLCRKCELNEFVLKKGFKILFGYAPIKYYTRLKMIRAEELLLENKLSIAEIAYTLGYHSPGNFTFEFKKHAKCTPLDYKARNKL
jgi:AraC-like DNA-binding protein